MQILQCKPEDLERTAKFYHKVTAYLSQHINYPKWTHGAYPAEGSVRQAIADNSQYICVDEGGIVGAFVLNDDPQGNYSVGNWSVSIEEGKYMILHALATDPESYHKGVARFMVEYCMNAAKERGYQALRLDVVPDNIPARKLYETLGFLFAGEKDLERGIEEIPSFALYEWNCEK